MLGGQGLEREIKDPLRRVAAKMFVDDFMLKDGWVEVKR